MIVSGSLACERWYVYMYIYILLVRCSDFLLNFLSFNILEMFSWKEHVMMGVTNWQTCWDGV